MTKYFKIEPQALEYLHAQDTRLSGVIESIGEIKRPIQPNLFVSLVSSIIGQQISQKAKETVWFRLNEMMGEITPEKVCEYSSEVIQKVGLSHRKVSYLKSVANHFLEGNINRSMLEKATDEEVIDKLTEIKGVGRWTAEMQLIFSLERPDVLSFDDFAIRRGLRMIYQEPLITRQLFQEYKEKFSPYNTTASLYIWEVSAGAIPTLKDVK